MVKYTWFPGHMAKALQEMKKKIKFADLVLEVRDARAPASTVNRELDKVIGCRRRLIVLNKADLADPSKTKEFRQLIEDQGNRSIATSATSRGSIHKLLSTAVSWLQAERPTADVNTILVVGVPNCGKSSIINALKHAAISKGQLPGEQARCKTARTGPLPGVTLQMAGFQVSEEPRVYILDTPGVTLPNLRTDDIALKLAVIGAIKSSIVPEDEQVKHLLKMMCQPTHLRALRAAMSAAPHVAPGRTRSLVDPRWSGTCKLARLLHEMLSEELQQQGAGNKSMLVADAAAGTVVGTAPAAGGTPAWHPGLEDEEYDPDYQRLHRLLCAYNAAGHRDPSRQQGVYSRVLKAYREGQLGRFTWDDVSELQGAADAQIGLGRALGSRGSGG